MKIELRKIEHSERLSRETEAFSADLYIDGKKAGIASNSGRGGSTGYQPYDEDGLGLIREAEKWCEGLPPKVYPADEYGGPLTLDMNLEHYIDDLLEQHLKQRFQKKMERSFKQHVVISDNPEAGYRGIKFNMPIATILADEKGRKFLVDYLAKVKGSLKGNERILNDNIPETVLKDAGLKEAQYVKPKLDSDTATVKKKPPRQGKGKQRL